MLHLSKRKSCSNNRSQFNLRVVTNVVHNVYTTPIHEYHDRALLAFIELCGEKAPLTNSQQAAMQRGNLLA
jgi:hypothetical protein